MLYKTLVVQQSVTSHATYIWRGTGVYRYKSNGCGAASKVDIKVGEWRREFVFEAAKKEIYSGKKVFFSQTKPRGMPQFWQGLHSVKEWYERGRSCLLKSGAQTHFLA